MIDLQDVVDHGNDDLAEAIENNAERYVSHPFFAVHKRFKDRARRRVLVAKAM